MKQLIKSIITVNAISGCTKVAFHIGTKISSEVPLNFLEFVNTKYERIYICIYKSITHLTKYYIPIEGTARSNVIHSF